MIRLNDCTLSVTGRTLLSNLSFELEAGTLCGILGPSGLGKSTLLKYLAGLAGNEITMTGGTTSSNSRAQLLKGYSGQNEKLLPWLTAEENIALPEKICKNQNSFLSELEREKLLQLLEIHKLLNKSAANLSGGEAQRIILARTLLHAEQVVLLDEPFSQLDAALRHRMLPKLRDWLKSNNYTGLIIMHAPEDALQFCDKSLILNHDGYSHQEIWHVQNQDLARVELLRALFYPVGKLYA